VHERPLQPYTPGRASAVAESVAGANTFGRADIFARAQARWTRRRFGGTPKAGAPPKESMRQKLRTAAGRAVYKMRKAIVEPAFGQIEEQLGFRRFSLRGEEKVGRGWKPACAASNLPKLFRAGWVPEMA